MFELSQIILWILWRLRPVMAVEANLVDILQSGFAFFQDEEELALMADHPDYCARISAALADAHAKLDLLIYLRACEIGGLRSRARDFTPNLTTTRSGRTPQDCWASFRRLVLRFDDRERLAQKRAEHLQRERSDSPLRLDAPHQSTSPMLRMVEDAAHALEVLHRLRRGGIVISAQNNLRRTRCGVSLSCVDLTLTINMPWPPQGASNTSDFLSETALGAL